MDENYPAAFLRASDWIVVDGKPHVIRKVTQVAGRIRVDFLKAIPHQVFDAQENVSLARRVRRDG